MNVLNDAEFHLLYDLYTVYSTKNLDLGVSCIHISTSKT